MNVFSRILLVIISLALIIVVTAFVIPKNSDPSISIIVVIGALIIGAIFILVDRERVNTKSLRFISYLGTLSLVYWLVNYLVYYVTFSIR